MSIAATVNSNYANSFTAGADPALTASAGLRSRIIAQLVAHLLQAPSNSTPGAAAVNAAPSANSSAAIILTQLLFSTKSPGSTDSLGPANGAALMELNLNQLLNGAMLSPATTSLPPELLAKPQVIEALVLQNTLLPAMENPTAMRQGSSPLPLLILPTPSDSTATASSANTLYRVNVEWQNRLIQLLSPQPLPTGTRVPLQIDPPTGANPRAAITLLRPEVAAKILLAQNTAATAPTTPPPAPPALSAPMQTVQQSLRELLPRQQALHTLVPLLQKFITPTAREQLPPPIFKAVAQLLQSLPKPAQLNSAESVKQAIQNSGSFLEAKLTQTTTATAGAEPLARIATTDLKAQIAALLALVRQTTPPAATPNKTATTPSAAQFVAEDEFVYTKPAVHNAASSNTATHESESLDSLLSQLGKLLQAGFARIQLNQLDSVSARHSSHETQTPMPTWVLELPLRTPQGVDQLQLRIEQRQQRTSRTTQTRTQWNVEIAFDLHAAGKLAASLAIIDKSVSATLWAERAQTHRHVREEMAYLRAGLESVGVNVTEMQCRHGLPTPRSTPISQRLVDVHT